jgi:hypothetical protein
MPHASSKQKIKGDVFVTRAEKKRDKKNRGKKSAAAKRKEKGKSSYLLTSHAKICFCVSTFHAPLDREIRNRNFGVGIGLGLFGALPLALPRNAFLVDSDH